MFLASVSYLYIYRAETVQNVEIRKTIEADTITRITNLKWNWASHLARTNDTGGQKEYGGGDREMMPFATAEDHPHDGSHYSRLRSSSRQLCRIRSMILNCGF